MDLYRLARRLLYQSFADGEVTDIDLNACPPPHELGGLTAANDGRALAGVWLRAQPTAVATPLSLPDPPL